MASLIKRPNSNYWVQFLDASGRRQTLRLGRQSKRAAEHIRMRLERLIEARAAHCALDTDTAAWLAQTSDVLHRRLVKLGLAALRESSRTSPATVGGFTADFIARREKTHKPNTLRNLRAAAKELTAYFGTDKPMASVNKADVANFRLSLSQRGLAANTIARTIGRAKQFWLAARDAELVSTTNPFAGQDCQVRPVESRFEYADLGTIDKVIDACPDHEWRLIVALARFAGLRCPSEVLSLKWDDINWAEHRMLVKSSKLEHHAGGGQRWVPIFEALGPYLDDAFHLAVKGTVNCITRYRTTNANLRTQLGRICAIAGVELWGKPFQNLRSSAEIDLNRDFP